MISWLYKIEMKHEKRHSIRFILTSWQSISRFTSNTTRKRILDFGQRFSSVCSLRVFHDSKKHTYTKNRGRQGPTENYPKVLRQFHYTTVSVGGGWWVRILAFGCSLRQCLNTQHNTDESIHGKTSPTYQHNLHTARLKLTCVKTTRWEFLPSI